MANGSNDTAAERERVLATFTLDGLAHKGPFTLERNNDWLVAVCACGARWYLEQVDGAPSCDGEED